MREIGLTGQSARPGAAPGDGDLELYLRVLAGEAGEGRYFDVRWGTSGDPMRRGFIPALRIEAAAALIRRLASRVDVYVGVALRDSRVHGGRRAIGASHLVYVECDVQLPAVPGALACPPTMEVASGTAGHSHLYWRLDRRAAPGDVEVANGKLALALGGDLTSVDIARVLRPPETLNHKHRPPQAVSLLAYRASAVYALGELVADLPDPGYAMPRPKRSHGARRRTALDRELLAIPPAEYVRALVGCAPNRAGKIICPFHDDHRPSLQLYADGSFYCFGCRRGGTIYDFAAHLWGAGTRGSEFIALRERLRFAIAGGVAGRASSGPGQRTPSRPANRLRSA